jgi:hypothetical protein
MQASYHRQSLMSFRRMGLEGVRASLYDDEAEGLTFLSVRT